MVNGRTEAEDMEREYQRQSLRDHFAAAALTGLMVHANDDIDEETFDTPSDIAYMAYQMADAMLRERSRTGQKLSESDSSRAACTDHDAAPAARATADRYVRRAAADGDSDRTDKAAPRPSEGTGKHPAPPCVETDRPPCDMQPPAASDGSGRDALRDVARPDTKGKVAGGPEHHISEAEIDALEFVVEEGRIANIHDYGILRSLLIRLRQEWEFRDSPEPIAGCDIDRSQPIRIDLSQPCMVDPPSGWKWGFPRRYDPASDGPMNEWLVRNGYPKHLADQGLDCTFTLCGNVEADK